MATSYEEYMDLHPWRNWTQDRWPERSMLIDLEFHQPDVFFTPIVGPGLVMPEGVGWDQAWYAKAEIVPAHINHRPLGRYQRMTTALYFDIRQRKLYSRNRYGAKVQYDRRDQMVTRFGGDTPRFIEAVLRDQLAAQIKGIHEKVCRDGIIENALMKFMYNGSKFSLGTADFSDLPGDASGAFDVKLLEDMALRTSYRSGYVQKQYGTYSQPVPGVNFNGSALISTTTGVFWSLWNSEEQQWMIDLRDLQDSRVINGGQVVYRNRSVIQDTGHTLVLWNAGVISKQVAVTLPIKWGDGAPDPETEGVDGYMYTGQSSANTRHYVQCTDFDTGDFEAGDVVSIHVKRRDDYGITDGCDFLDGYTYVGEIYSVDADNNRLVFRDPITEAYEDPFDYDSLGGTSVSTAQAYAFITKAQHVHPIIVLAGREPVQWVMRRQPDGSLIEYIRPRDDNVDYPSVERVTANWYGEINQWNPDIVEIFFVNAPFANRGDVTW